MSVSTGKVEVKICSKCRSREVPYMAGIKLHRIERKSKIYRRFAAVMIGSVVFESLHQTLLQECV